MEHRPLGRTGVSVSKLCLGAMMFGAWGNPDHDESIRIIHRAMDAGINFIDTADVYSAGESEEIVGKALKSRRDDVVLATKVYMPIGDDSDPNGRGTSRRWIIQEVEHSLRRLNTDWIDLYQVHRPTPDTDLEETLGVLTDLVHQGKVLASGLNNTFESIFGALGTAIMASIAVTHTNSLLESGSAALPALNDGFGLAFAIAIAFPAFGLLASIALRPAATTLLAPATNPLETR